ncbi:MAG TPA: hypothetical protein VN673_01980 [Clostridia bacterium]|nr:hypothetical protein [Clostridia bacterium]
MNRVDEPATAKQMEYLREHGYEPDHPLTKTEALDLIRVYGGQRDSGPARVQPEAARTAFDYRKAFEEAAGPQREAAQKQRLEFWIDTCREPTQSQLGSAEVRELYRTRGCLFCAPTRMQTQEVLQALDLALSYWDRDHPELFYETLKLNFPELVRSR